MRQRAAQTANAAAPARAARGPAATRCRENGLNKRENRDAASPGTARQVQAGRIGPAAGRHG